MAEVCKGINWGPNRCRHIENMWWTPGYGIDVLIPPKYPYFDCSNSSKWELYYIPEEDFCLGHPVHIIIHRNTDCSLMISAYPVLSIFDNVLLTIHLLCCLQTLNLYMN